MVAASLIAKNRSRWDPDQVATQVSQVNRIYYDTPLVHIIDTYQVYIHVLYINIANRFPSSAHRGLLGPMHGATRSTHSPGIGIPPYSYSLLVVSLTSVRYCPLFLLFLLSGWRLGVYPEAPSALSYM